MLHIASLSMIYIRMLKVIAKIFLLVLDENILFLSVDQKQDTVYS